jgi:peptidoglycan hydrolase-like protein with peptidoglycan-binding domain
MLSGLLRNLSIPKVPQGKRTLRSGMSGMDVARCQNLLNANLTYSPPPLWVDGMFGQKTDRRVREFQRKNRLTVDGLVGPQTMAALEAGR